jgi:hypothetical protein
VCACVCVRACARRRACVAVLVGARAGPVFCVLFCIRLELVSFLQHSCNTLRVWVSMPGAESGGQGIHSWGPFHTGGHFLGPNPERGRFHGGLGGRRLPQHQGISQAHSRTPRCRKGVRLKCASPTVLFCATRLHNAQQLAQPPWRILSTARGGIVWWFPGGFQRRGLHGNHVGVCTLGACLLPIWNLLMMVAPIESFFFPFSSLNLSLWWKLIESPRYPITSASSLMFCDCSLVIAVTITVSALITSRHHNLLLRGTA